MVQTKVQSLILRIFHQMLLLAKEYGRAAATGIDAGATTIEANKTYVVTSA